MQCVRYGNHLVPRDPTLLATLSEGGGYNFFETYHVQPSVG